MGVDLGLRLGVGEGGGEEVSAEEAFAVWGEVGFC